VAPGTAGTVTTMVPNPSPGSLTLLSTAIPVFTLIVSVVLGYDRLSLRRIVGILLAASGVIYLVDPLRADFSSHTNIGNLLIVANSFSYAAYIAISTFCLCGMQSTGTPANSCP